MLLEGQPGWLNLEGFLACHFGTHFREVANNTLQKCQCVRRVDCTNQAGIQWTDTHSGIHHALGLTARHLQSRENINTRKLGLQVQCPSKSALCARATVISSEAAIPGTTTHMRIPRAIGRIGRLVESGRISCMSFWDTLPRSCKQHPPEVPMRAPCRLYQSGWYPMDGYTHWYSLRSWIHSPAFTIPREH